MASTTKYIFVTGGVSSSLGKGIISASVARLLKARGFSVTIQKLDPYINVDPGTLNPANVTLQKMVLKQTWTWDIMKGFLIYRPPRLIMLLRAESTRPSSKKKERETTSGKLYR